MPHAGRDTNPLHMYDGLLSTAPVDPDSGAALLRSSVLASMRVKRAREYPDPSEGRARDGGYGAVGGADTPELRVIPMDPTTLRNRGAHATRLAPTYHPSWKLTRVVSGHGGIVHCLCVDSSNDFFVSGSSDRMVKVWDLATGKLRLTLPSHIQSVRALCLSSRMPYMFSASEDKTIRCWDLEHNEVVRHYHGSLGGVYALALHPDLDLLVSGGSDGAVRLWDIRTRAEVFTLLGHKDAVNVVMAQSCEPQILSGGSDSTVRLWDLCVGRCYPDGTATHHKKGVRCAAFSPTDFTIATCSADSIRKWRLPSGKHLHTFDTATHSPANDVVNACAVNHAGVFVSGHGSGALRFYDWPSSQCFQSAKVTPQPGSVETEACVMSAAFDHSGSRLITGQADKTINVWQEDLVSSRK